MKSTKRADWKRRELASKLRAARGIESQGKLAARSGVSDGTISLLEQAQLKRIPKPVTIVRLALATGNDPKEWLTLTGAKVANEEMSRIIAQVKSSPGVGSPKTRVRALAETQWETMDLREYVERRCDELADRMVALSERLERVSSWQDELANRLRNIEKAQEDLRGILKK